MFWLVSDTNWAHHNLWVTTCLLTKMNISRQSLLTGVVAVQKQPDMWIWTHIDVTLSLLNNVCVLVYNIGCFPPLISESFRGWSFMRNFTVQYIKTWNVELESKSEGMCWWVSMMLCWWVFRKMIPCHLHFIIHKFLSVLRCFCYG